MGYLLSIVIPTKDRYKYLSKTIKDLSKLNQDLVEIIIQDNTFKNTDIIEIIDHLPNKNIKYYHETTPLSQTGNSDLALSHSTGEYCCYIGDDDTVLPDILEVVQFIKQNHIESCICDVADYYWPDVVFEKKRPWLKYNTKQTRTSIYSSKEKLRFCMSYGMQDIYVLPRVYHGIVSRNILEQIYDITGTFFPGPSPDMANATACALLIDKYLHTETPLVFSGVGYTSGAGMGQRGEHKGELKNGKQLPADAEEKWSKRIPKLWLGYTVWTESAEKALIAMGKEELIEKINYSAMEAKVFLKYPEYRKEMLIRQKTTTDYIKLFYQCLRFMIRYYYEIGRDYLREKRKYLHREYEPCAFETAVDAVKQSNALLKKKGLLY